MAKKKTAVESSKTDAELRKLFGDDCLYDGSRIMESTPEVRGLSPRLDEGLGGGIQKGTIVTLSGPSGCGKTTTALHAAKVWQDHDDQVYYGAAEERLWKLNLTGVRGLDPGRVKVLGSSEDRIMSAQDYMLGFEKILRNEKDVLLIIDSISILSEENEMKAEKPGEGQVGGANRLVGSFLRRMAPIITLRRNTVIAISQVYTNIGGKKKYKVNMPLKLEFARGTGLECDWAEPLMESEAQVGQVVHWKVVRTPLGPPGKKIASIVRYGVGIDLVGEVLEEAKDLLLIRKGGSWLSLEYEGGDARKFQGNGSLYAFFEENPDQFDVLRRHVADRKGVT